MTTQQRFKASTAVFNPNDVGTLGSQYLKERTENKSLGVPFPSAKLANRVYPMFPGEVMSVLARPGHAKTGLMMYWARKRANDLKGTNRVVVYGTWEQSIEELHAFHVAATQHLSVTKMAKGELSEEDIKKVMASSIKRVEEPLWFLGHSMMRRSGRRPINTETLQEALEHITQQNEGFEVDCVFLDYLQRIHPIVDAGNPVTNHSKNMEEVKNIALGFGVPIVVGVQASRQVEELPLPIPEMHHAQWTSNIEQTSDRIISLVRPRRYKKVGEEFGSIRVMGDTDLLVSVLKQKLGEANFAEWVKFNPVYNVLDGMEIGV